jgi:membrane protein
VVTAGFTWYLDSGFARYELIYGWLGTIVILMFWIYLNSWIILFGANLAASIAQPANEISPETSEPD